MIDDYIKTKNPDVLNELRSAARKIKLHKIEPDINGQENPLIKEIFESIPNIQQEGFNKLSEIAKIAQDLNYDNVLFHIHNILSDIEKRSRKSEARSQI